MALCGQSGVSNFIVLSTCILIFLNCSSSLANNEDLGLAQDQTSKPAQTKERLARLPGESSPGSSLNNLKPLIEAALAAVPKQPQPAQQTNQIDAQAQSPASRPAQLSSATNSQQQQQQQRLSSAGISAASNANDEPVIQLSYSSINDEILRKRTANLVYFNANFNNCRHCFKFYSIWRELALDTRWWRQVIKLFAINCSEDDNIEVCRKAGVTQFPQVKFYWIMSQSLEQDGQRLRILGKSVHAMRHLIMDKVLESYTEHKALLQRAQQQRKGMSGGLPNPFQAFMPFITQLLAPSASPASPSSSSGAGGLLNTLLGSAGGSKTNAGSGLQSVVTDLVGQLGSGGINFQGITDMINALAGVATWRKSLTIQPMPNNWPDFEPIDVGGDAQRLLDSLPLDAARGIGALLIMENPEYLYIGLETMLDLSPYSNSTYLARVRDDRSLLSRNLTKRDDIQTPALIYITDMREAKLLMTAPKFTSDEDLRRAFVRTFERRQVRYPVKHIWSLPPSNQQPETSLSQEDEEILARVNQVYMSDLLNTVRASLMEQVFRHPDLSDDQYNSLVKYVYALINYFPFKNDVDDRLKFFQRLHAWLQNQVSPIDIKEYKKQFHDIDEALGEKQDWMACKSLSITTAIPHTSHKSAASFLFENPSQLGKVVSNITRLFRTGQQKAGQLKSLVGMLTSSLNPVMLGNSSSSASTKLRESISGASVDTGDQLNKGGGNKDESPIERLFGSLTNGTLGSDSSILKLISTALTGSQHNDTASGKSKFAREYPCGAWKLAHVMVVNEYIKDSPRKDVKHIVLQSLYQYMLHFYTCPTCGNRVSDISSEFRLNLDEHLNEQGDSIMLLWKLHNRVNKRLESETRPGSPIKQQFPSESLCPKCRGTKPQNDMVSTPNWQEKYVLAFLVHHYRAQSIIKSNTESSSSTSEAEADNSVVISVDAVFFSVCSLISTILIYKQGKYIVTQ